MFVYEFIEVLESFVAMFRKVVGVFTEVEVEHWFVSFSSIE